MPDKPTHTEAQWEMAQGEVHDLRGLRAAIEGGARNVESGLWTTQTFLEWLWPALLKHDANTLERFKNITARYRHWRCANCGSTINAALHNHPSWCPHCGWGEVSGNGLPNSTVTD